MSIGVERIYALILKRKKGDVIKSADTLVYVCGIGSGTLIERMQICKELWEAGIAATFQFKETVKLTQQFKNCEKDAVPVAIVIGSGEIEKKVVGIKDQTRSDAEQFEVSREGMVEAVRMLLKEQEDLKISNGEKN
jgi:histidyl-tRNA synthetase